MAALEAEAQAAAEQAEAEGRKHPGVPDDKAQRNFTDTESRIIPAPGGKDFLQAYNCPQIPHLRLLGWLLWAYSRCGVSTGVLIGLCAASLRGLATVSHQLWSLSG